MNCIAINSLDDPRLAPYRDLKASNLTRWSGLFIAEGDKLVRRLLASDYAADSLLLGEKHLDAFHGIVPADVPVFVVPEHHVEAIIGFNFHRGVLGCGRRKTGKRLEGILSSMGTKANHRSASQTVVVCPNVQDPGNLGSILRTSAALGVDLLLLGLRCADPFSRRVLRVSMGAGFELPVVTSPDLPRDLTSLRDAWGFQLFAAVSQAGAEHLADVDPPQRSAILFGGEGYGLDSAWLADVDPPQRSAILFGGEGYGLDSAWLELCQRHVTIPMREGADSLNVGVAAGIVIHHLRRSATLPDSNGRC